MNEVKGEKNNEKEAGGVKRKIRRKDDGRY